MNSPSMPGRRLAAAAVTVALAVTVGSLAAPAATATAPAAPLTATEAQQQEVIPFPLDSAIYSAGPTGFLTGQQTTSTTRTYRWTRYEDGVTTELSPGTYGVSKTTDLVTTREGTVYTMRDMATDAAPLVIDVGGLGSTYALRGIAGSTLVMSAPTATGGSGIHLVSQPVGGAPQDAVLDRKVTGLPEDAVITRVKADSPDTAVVLYAGTVNGTRQNRAAVVDIATATVIEEYGTGDVTGFSDTAVSATRLAWIERRGYSALDLAVTRRDTGETERFPLPYADRVAIALVGDWVTYTLLGAVNWTIPAPLRPLTARSLTTGETVELLDHVKSSVIGPDGTQMARGGTLAQGEGLYRISVGENGAPAATLVASTGEPTALALKSQAVPEVVDLDRDGGIAPLSWTFNQLAVRVSLVLTHTASQKQWTWPEQTWSGQTWSGQSTATIRWDGRLTRGKTAYNGAYTWQMTAKRPNGIGAPVTASGTFTVVREHNPHDFDDNGATDLLTQSPAGNLWRDELHREDTSYAIDQYARTMITSGWQIYDRTEAAGNIGGAAHGDIVARDKAGVLWGFLGKGDGTFAPRLRIGAGWGTYSRLTAGSDLTGDGKPDLVASDTTGALWLHKGTGNWQAPYANRVKISPSGWNAYTEITAVGNIAGGPAGDLVARDTYGVLWLHLGKGDGTFAPRLRIGGGWNAYNQLVGAGDINRDGRPDLAAFGPAGGKVYFGTGDWKAPLGAPQSNTLYAGWGGFANVV